MKKLLIALVVVFVGLNLVACAEKKDNSTRLTRGTNNSGVNSTVYGWNLLNTPQYQEVVLDSQNQNPASVGSAFMGANKNYFLNSIIMRLRFVGNQLDPNTTYVGLRFYEHPSSPPDAYLLGPQSEGITAIYGSRNGDEISVVFEDGGAVAIHGRIYGQNFVGQVTFDGANYLGSFSVPVQYSIVSN